jgi:hypothetical protein
VEAEEDEEEEEERDDDLMRSSSKLMFCSRAIFSISRWGFQATIISKIKFLNKGGAREEEKKRNDQDSKILATVFVFVCVPKDQDLENPRWRPWSRLAAMQKQRPSRALYAVG